MEKKFIHTLLDESPVDSLIWSNIDGEMPKKEKRIN